jgi:hypothetical protein
MRYRPLSKERPSVSTAESKELGYSGQTTKRLASPTRQRPFLASGVHTAVETDDTESAADVHAAVE